jgi:hypothetical protein
MSTRFKNENKNTGKAELHTDKSIIKYLKENAINHWNKR